MALRNPGLAPAVRARYHFVKVLLLWNISQRHANWIMPRRTRALPARSSRQCPGAARHDPIGMALADVPEQEYLDKVVSSADGRRQAGIAQSHDRRFGTQTADRLVALRHDRRSPGRCRPAFGDMSEL